jgi:hypothetical protein
MAYKYGHFEKCIRIQGISFKDAGGLTMNRDENVAKVIFTRASERYSRSHAPEDIAKRKMKAKDYELGAIRGVSR